MMTQEDEEKIIIQPAFLSHGFYECNIMYRDMTRIEEQLKEQ